MKLLNRLLSIFGYTLYNSRFHREKFMARNEFYPVEQLFHKYHHDAFFYVQIGGEKDDSYDPLIHLAEKKNARGLKVDPHPGLFRELAGKTDIPSIDLLILYAASCDRVFFDEIDFRLLSPPLVSVEHGFSDSLTDPGELNILVKKLLDAGYEVHIQNFDLIAYLPR